MEPDRRTGRVAAWIAVGLVGMALSPLLIGWEPVGGDPDRIYRPIKEELARAIEEGRLPLWSDRFGLGIPLLAESHAGALYPPNQVLYRVFDIGLAYRLAMWAHYVAMAAATFAYARVLGISPWGSALAGVAFSLCGFQAIHSSHEWAYQTLAYLPLVMLLADRYAARGRLGWLAGLALAWASQLTIGHFQMQLWTGGLAFFTGCWRIIIDRRPRRRVLGLAAALAWALMIAVAQLGPSWELARFVGHDRRSFAELAFYSYPPAHWAEPAAPRLFRDWPGDPESAYWFGQQTTGFESAFYIGTIPLILAIVGLAGGRRLRGLGAWWAVVAGSLLLATMPRWWPQGYAALLNVPGLNLFRCPARYTALAMFGLALMAGAGLDETIRHRRFGIGLASAIVFGVVGIGWAWVWFQRFDGGSSLDMARWLVPIGWTALAWVVAIGVVIAWRAGRVGPWLLLLATALELGFLYYSATTQWGWSVPLPEASPTLERLAAEKPDGVGLVAGALDNLPVRAGRATGSPYLGFPLPMPNDLLDLAQGRRGDPLSRAWASRYGQRWLRRLGVSHGIWPGPPPTEGFTPIQSGQDPALDLLAYRPAGAPRNRTWTLYRLDDPFPTARAATHAVVVPNREALLEALSTSNHVGDAYFLPADLPESDREDARARQARVIAWDGGSGTVESDGACIVVLRRTFYPGWTYQVADQPARPVCRVDGGLQALRIPRGGTNRFRVHYKPTGWRTLCGVSITAMAAAIAALGLAWFRGHEPTPNGCGLTREVGASADGIDQHR